MVRVFFLIFVSMAYIYMMSVHGMLPTLYIPIGIGLLFAINAALNLSLKGHQIDERLLYTNAVLNRNGGATPAEKTPVEEVVPPVTADKPAVEGTLQPLTLTGNTPSEEQEWREPGRADEPEWKYSSHSTQRGRQEIRTTHLSMIKKEVIREVIFGEEPFDQPQKPVHKRPSNSRPSSNSNSNHHLRLEQLRSRSQQLREKTTRLRSAI